MIPTATTAAPATACKPRSSMLRIIIKRPIRFACFYLTIAIATGCSRSRTGWNTFKEQLQSAWRNQP
jgi:hypothetical protein